MNKETVFYMSVLFMVEFTTDSDGDLRGSVTHIDHL